MTPGPGATYGSETWWNGTNANPPTGQGGFGVSNYFSRPAYQNGLSTASGRSVPDVVMPINPALNGIQICQADSGGCPDGLLWGGTSTAAPEMAGLTAILDNQLGTNIGNFNDAVYPFANTPAFHTAANMGSDFAHVGLGDPNPAQLLLSLEKGTVGSVSATGSIAIAVGASSPLNTTGNIVPADGATQGTVQVNLADQNGIPVSGKAVTLSPDPGSSAVVSAASGPSDSQSGSVVFKVTDTVPENVTFTATDMTDGTTLTTQPTLQFVTPMATGAEIYGGPSQVNNDGTSQATITVYLENALGQPASGKTVTLTQTGSATITPSGASTPNNTSVTNSAGNAVFTATDTNAETVQFTGTDVTDGNLPVPGSVAVNFAPTTATCPTTLPTAASGYSVSSFASGFAYATEPEIFTGNFTGGGCGQTETAPAFDSSGNAYIGNLDDGTIHVLPPSGGTPSSSNALPDANFPPDTLGQFGLWEGRLALCRTAQRVYWRQ